MPSPATHSPLRIEEICSLTRFNEIAPAWDDLCGRALVSYPMLTHAWLDSWWRAFGDGSEMRVLLVWCGEQLVGGAPFAIRGDTAFGRQRRILGMFANSWVDRIHVLLTEPASPVVDSMVAHLARIRREFDLIELAPLDAAESQTHLLIAALRREFRIGTEEHLQSPYLKLPEEWEELIQGLSSSFRQTVRRKVRKVETMPGVSMRIARDASCMAAIETVSLESWQHDQGTSMASSEQIRGFYARIIQAAAIKGTLRCAIMESDGEPVAFEFNLVHRSTLHNFKLGFRKQYAELSTGIVLKARVLKDAVSGADAATLREYDFMGTTEPYKLNWAKNVRSHIRVWAVQRTSGIAPIIWVKFDLVPFVRTRFPGLAKHLRALRDKLR